MEINEIRPFFSRAFNNMRKLEEVLPRFQDSQTTQTYSMASSSNHY